MKKRISWTLFILLLVSPPLIMWLCWLFKPNRELRILVMDKTVLNSTVPEHMSLYWVLNNERFAKADSHRYDPLVDYSGFFPDGNGQFEVRDLENFTNVQLDSLSDVHDACFYTDMYGIYHEEWDDTYFPEKRKNDDGRIGERSRILYGGMTGKDLLFMKKMKQKQKLVLTEFNLIASPTSKGVRREFEKEFGVHWTGWIGRYFDNLDTSVNKELPQWLITNYMRDNGNRWPFTRSGIAFVREDDKIVILENTTHLDHEFPMIHTPQQNVDKYGINARIKYPFWFDIMRVDTPNQVLSTYRIEANSSGDSLMNAFQIPAEFPALIHHQKGHTFYYLAGDFSDNPINRNLSYFRYIENFSFFFTGTTPTDRSGFFWRYYLPLMQTILNDYEKTLSK